MEHFYYHALIKEKSNLELIFLIKNKLLAKNRGLKRKISKKICRFYRKFNKLFITKKPVAVKPAKNFWLLYSEKLGSIDSLVKRVINRFKILTKPIKKWTRK